MVEMCNSGWKEKTVAYESKDISIAYKIEMFIFPLFLCKSISLVYDYLNI